QGGRMSKTETQSRAESLAKMLEFGAFSPNLLQNEIGVRKGAAAELRRLDAENKALIKALEAVEMDAVEIGMGESTIGDSARYKVEDALQQVRAAQAAAKDGGAA
ncbi:hypothetical protein ACOART_12230, partial [Glaesserella parasuis]|uniref:hypothetical protein n=1 Tax=Glaesserella parasuis TaxID=738 RepID=UPI003B7E042D